MRHYFAIFTLALCAPLANAASLATWDFEGSVTTPANQASGLMATAVTSATGSIGFAGGNAPSAGSAASLTGFATGNRYEFTLIAARGQSISLTGLSFDDRASSTGPSAWTLYVNGNPVAGGATSPSFAGSPMNVVPLSVKAVAGSVTFWLVGTDAASNSGTWRLDNLSIEGSVSPVPLPLPAALLGSALLGLAGLRVRG